MRQKLNENPLVQLAVVGGLALIVGVIFLMRMNAGGGSSSESTAEPQPQAAAPVESAPTAEAATAAPVESVPTDTAAPEASGVGFEEGPGLPAEIVNAWDDGDAVVLLIVRRGGIDDRRVEAMVKGLSRRPDTAVFVTEAGRIAKYSRITQGVDVGRVPALVVLRPKRLSDGPMPVASVSYGFRGPASVLQALEDALYKGRQDLPYYPK